MNFYIWDENRETYKYMDPFLEKDPYIYIFLLSLCFSLFFDRIKKKNGIFSDFFSNKRKINDFFQDTKIFEL